MTAETRKRAYNKQWQKDNRPYFAKKSSEFRKNNPQKIKNNNRISNQREKEKRKTPSGRATSLLSGAKQRSQRKGLDCTITFEWVKERITTGFCEATGLPLVLGLGEGPMKPFAPSLDRFDNTLGYTEENTMVVCWIYNSAKGTGTHEDVTKFVDAFYNKHIAS